MRMLKSHRIRLLVSVLLAVISYAVVLPRQRGGQSDSTPVVPSPSPASPVVRPAQPPVMRQPIPIAQPIRAIPLIKKHERFTQTEAYVQSPKLRDLVMNTFRGNFAVVEHMDIVSRLMAKEAELRDTHWAFYHGTSNVWNLWQDTYTALFNEFNPSIAKDGDADFIFLRTKGKANLTPGDFLVGALQENGLVDDNTGEVKAILLSANMFPWGNTAISGESTWKSAMINKAHEMPSREDYETIMDEFGVSHQYIDQLMQLVGLMQSKQQTLIQIFVPKNIVDDVGYLSWTRGMPAHQASIDWVKKSGIRGKGGQTGAVRAIGILKEKFAKERVKNPLYADMLETIEKGAYSLDHFLTKCCNDPLGVPNMDTVQARLIFTDDILLNPASGVKMFRYTGVSKDKMEQYRSRLNDLIKKIVATKK